MSFTLWRGVVGLVKPTRRPGTLEELIRMLPEGIGVVPLLLNFKAGSEDDVDTRNGGGPATFMGAVGGLSGKHLVVGLFHRRLHPFLQDRIGEIGDTIGWLPAATIGHVGVRSLEGNGPRSAARRRKQIVHANRAVNPPAGADICREIGNGSFATCVRCQGGACSRYDGHETNQTMFGHVPPLAAQR